MEQEPQDDPLLCANSCGFFGTAATNNLCSKCYKEFFLKQSKASMATVLKENKVSETVFETSDSVSECREAKATSSEERTTSEDPEEKVSNRCSFCRKRVGLTGFKCRCERTFCSLHRYSDKHNCLFDYRSAGQDAIAKENPLVKADKVEKI